MPQGVYMLYSVKHRLSIDHRFRQWKTPPKKTFLREGVTVHLLNLSWLMGDISQYFLSLCAPDPRTQPPLVQTHVQMMHCYILTCLLSHIKCNLIVYCCAVDVCGKFTCLLPCRIINFRLSYKTSPLRLLELCCSGWRIISANTEPPCWVWVLWLARVKYQYHLSNCQATWQHMTSVIVGIFPVSQSNMLAITRSFETRDRPMACPGCFPASCLVPAGRGSGSSWPWTVKDVWSYRYKSVWFASTVFTCT